MRKLTMALVLIASLAPAYGEAEQEGGASPSPSAVSGIPPASPEQGTPPTSLEGGMPSHPIGTVITPYGDFCPRCSKYGMGRIPVKRYEAEEAVRDYFMHKGFTVRVVEARGRFMRFDVFRGSILVDKVIFDRRTGRIRSIY